MEEQVCEHGCIDQLHSPRLCREIKGGGFDHVPQKHTFWSVQICQILQEDYGETYH